MNESSPLERFQKLLRELFEFDASDLDFGIYRILNHKRETISGFVDQRIPNIVSEALVAYQAGDRARAEDQRDSVLSEIRAALGPSALTAENQLRPEFTEVPLAKKLVAAEETLAKSAIPDAVEISVYNDLVEFFSRYYEAGDFYHRRRLRRIAPYALPYSGEELLLHWTNSDQYYVKTTDRFFAYSFRIAEFSVRFEVSNIDVPKEIADSVDEPKRFFLFSSAQLDGQELLCRFAWRPLTTEEKKTFGTRPQQKLNENIREQLLDAISDPVLRGHLCAAEAGIAAVDRHLGRFTGKNASDFFVHRDLEGFLTRELDTFLRQDVVGLGELLKGGQAGELALLRARVVRKIALVVIAFLAQLENFQLRLFEKRKFVLRTNFCVTLDRLPAPLRSEVATNSEQISEWSNDKFGEQGAAKVTANGIDDAVVESFPHLVVDTQYFDDAFKWKLIASFDRLDDSVDGLLVKSDNFHAMRLLGERYGQQLQCVYVDPPFNTESDQFIFKDTLRDSSWLTMMDNRLGLIRPLLRADGTLYVHLDHNSNYFMRMLLDRIMGADGFLNEIIWRIGWVSGYKTQAPSFVRNHETIFAYGVGRRPTFHKHLAAIPYVQRKLADAEDELKALRHKWDVPESADRVRVWVPQPDGTILKSGSDNKEGRYWMEDTWNCSEYDELNSNKIKRNVAEYTPNGSRLTQKPEQLLHRVLSVSSSPGDWVADFFGGSGTTAAVAQKMGRRFITVEPGAYFESDVLWRIKSVLSGRQVGVSNKVEYRGGGMVKYLELEQYEDVLTNIEFTRSGEDAQAMFDLMGDDYLLSYMLDFETSGSATLLNLDAFLTPFDYTLKVRGDSGTEAQAVDLVETFNLLIGLHVDRVLVSHDQDRLYVIVVGDRGGATTAVVWRNATGLIDDHTLLAADREHIDVQLNGLAVFPVRVLINGPCVRENTEAIEPEFKRLMFATSTPSL